MATETQAERMLRIATEAYEAVLSGRGIQEYEIGGGHAARRRFLKMSLSELRQEMEAWQRKVDAETNRAAGKRRRQLVIVRQPQ